MSFADTMIEKNVDLTALDGSIENSALVALMSALSIGASSCLTNTPERESNDWLNGQIYAIAKISKMIGQIKPKVVNEV